MTDASEQNNTGPCTMFRRASNKSAIDTCQNITTYSKTTLQSINYKIMKLMWINFTAYSKTRYAVCDS